MTEITDRQLEVLKRIAESGGVCHTAMWRDVHPFTIKALFEKGYLRATGTTKVGKRSGGWTLYSLTYKAERALTP